VLDLLGAPDDGVTRTLLRVVGIVLGLAANWLIFAWAITRLPRTDVPLRGVRRAALLGAVGLEVLKQFTTVYFEAVTGTPSGAVFGSLIGLLLFGYLVARLLLWVTAWAATARGNERLAPVPVPGPVVLRQEVVVERGASAGGLGVVLLVGLVAGAWLRGRPR
jgi:membrane protein